MKFGLLLLFLFLCGLVSSEKIQNEVEDEPTVADEADNDAPDLDNESDDSVEDEIDNDTPNLDSESDDPVDDESKNEESLDESNSNPEQFDSEDEENDVAENQQDQGEEDSKLKDPAPWRPKRYCKVVKVTKCRPYCFTKAFYVKKCVPICYYKTYYYYGKQIRKKICKKRCRNIRKTRKVCVKRCRPAKQKLCRYLYRRKICKSYLHCFLKPVCHYKRVVSYKTVCHIVPFFVKKCYKKCCFYFYRAKKIPLKPCGKYCIKRRKTKRVCKRKSFYKTIKVCKKKKVCVKRVRCSFKYYYGPWLKVGPVYY